MSALLEFFTDRTEELIQQLQTLVSYETPTHSKPHVDRMGSYLQEQFRSLGAEVTVYPREQVGDIVLAKWNPTASGKPLMMMGHMDTVWEVGTLAKEVPWRRDEYKLYGAGVLDMKAGIAIALATIRGLQERGEFPNRPIWMLCTSDEETGSDHSHDLILELAQQAQLCLVMEPAAENEGLKSSRKGIGNYWITAKGVASHAGSAPEEGVNAIIELAHQALALHQLNQLRQGTSVSVTLIEGGTTGNVIPPLARLYVDVRFFYRAEADRIDQAIKNLTPVLFGSQLEITGGIGRYPMERNETMIQGVEKARQLAEKVGFSLGEAAVGGVSDGNFTAAAGVPTLDGLGGHGDGMHALHEHVLIRSLPRRAALLAAILQEW